MPILFHWPSPKMKRKLIYRKKTNSCACFNTLQEFIEYSKLRKNVIDLTKKFRLFSSFMILVTWGRGDNQCDLKLHCKAKYKLQFYYFKYLSITILSYWELNLINSAARFNMIIYITNSRVNLYLLEKCLYKHLKIILRGYLNLIMIRQWFHLYKASLPLPHDSSSKFE